MNSSDGNDIVDVDGKKMGVKRSRDDPHHHHHFHHSQHDDDEQQPSKILKQGDGDLGDSKLSSDDLNNSQPKPISGNSLTNTNLSITNAAAPNVSNAITINGGLGMLTHDVTQRHLIFGQLGLPQQQQQHQLQQPHLQQQQDSQTDNEAPITTSTNTNDANNSTAAAAAMFLRPHSGLFGPNTAAAAAAATALDQQQQQQQQQVNMLRMNNSLTLGGRGGGGGGFVGGHVPTTAIGGTTAAGRGGGGGIGGSQQGMINPLNNNANNNDGGGSGGAATNLGAMLGIGSSMNTANNGNNGGVDRSVSASMHSGQIPTGGDGSGSGGGGVVVGGPSNGLSAISGNNTAAGGNTNSEQEKASDQSNLPQGNNNPGLMIPNHPPLPFPYRGLVNPALLGMGPGGPDMTSLLLNQNPGFMATSATNPLLAFQQQHNIAARHAQQALMMSSLSGFGSHGLIPGAAGMDPSALGIADPSSAAAAAAMMMGRNGDAAAAAAAGLIGGRSQHPPVDLYIRCDDDVLSDHQILLRKQIEFFEASPHEVQTVTHGRRKEILVGQVGIRCKYCASLPPRRRPKGAVYYPATLRALYQAAQNMAASHFTVSCERISPGLKAQFQAFQERKSRAGHGGKKYWADGAKAVGVIETQDEGLRFKDTMATTAAPANGATESSE